MAYVSPTITASSGTLAQLKSGGFSGQVELLIAANSGLTARQLTLIRLFESGDADQLFRATWTAVSNYLHGDNISHAVIAAALLDYSTVVKLWLAAIEEIAVLEAAATRTVATTITAGGNQATTKVGLS